MKEIRLVLPVPPSGNRYWRRAGTHIHRSTEARNYVELVSRMCRVKKIRPLAGEVSVQLHWYRARRAGDLDNFGKVCLDSLQGIAYTNDSQVRRIVSERFDDKQNPRMEILVTQYQEAA